jgi:hypothetical protein
MKSLSSITELQDGERQQEPAAQATWREELARRAGDSLRDYEKLGGMRRQIRPFKDNSLTIRLFALFVVFSVFLRQQNSAESKPVESSDGTTGEANK